MSDNFKYTPNQKIKKKKTLKIATIKIYAITNRLLLNKHENTFRFISLTTRQI